MMSLSNDPEWTDEGFIPRQEMDPVEQLRESILRQLIQGVRRGEIFDELVNQGYPAEYVVGLIDSVMQTGKHDGIVSGTAIYYGGQLVGFEEDRNSKRLRRIAERKQRKIREMKEGNVELSTELCFGDSLNQSESIRRVRRTFLLRWLLLFMVGLGAAAVVVVYWLIN